MPKEFQVEALPMHPINYGETNTIQVMKSFWMNSND